MADAAQKFAAAERLINGLRYQVRLFCSLVTNDRHFRVLVLCNLYRLLQE